MRRRIRTAPTVPFLLGIAVLSLGLSLAGRASAEEVSIRLHATGALVADESAVHEVDGAHFCSAAANPWAGPDQNPDERPPPYPFYRLVFGQAGPEAELERPGPSIGLSLSDYFPQAREHADPTNDSIEIVLQGRHFVGHSGLAEGGYRFAVTYREDGQGGGFVARHLVESSGAATPARASAAAQDAADEGGEDMIDVEGSWQCPRVMESEPEIVVSVHALFAGAVPARAEAQHLRLTHMLSCPHKVCADWRVVDQDDGTTFDARVDLRRLRLARRLRTLAEQGVVDLLVDGRTLPGRPLRVVPTALEGVTPRQTP
jgi:hypothetical protein